MLNRKWIAAALVVAAVIAVGALAAGCGDVDHDERSDEVPMDSAFLAAMTPHHEAAIEMAEMAQAQAEHPEVRRLAGAIIEAQDAEIEQMAQISDRLTGQSPEDAGHGAMGLSDEEMGMSMDPAHLEDADPFDRAFIDAMIPHHQGAIRMARMQLDGGSDAETNELAEAIIDAQSREIEQMNEWRERWYGAPSPAGGVPADSDEMHEGDDMHDSDEMHDSDDMHGDDDGMGH